MTEDPHLHTKIVVFDTFAFLGVFVNVAVLVPALFLPHISRRKIWFSLIISWILYSASYLLLLGRQMEPDPPLGPDPPFGLCIFQAALATSTPLVCIVASVCFAIDFTLQMTAAIGHGREVDRTLANSLAVFPWMIFIVIFAQVLLVVQDPAKDMVMRDPSHLFCTVQSRGLYLTTGILILVSAIILFPLEIYIAILFRRYSMRLPRKNFIHSTTVSLSVFIRLVLFTVISAIGIGVHSYIIARVNNTVTTCSVVLTCLPFLTGLIFGTNKDIIEAWMFWRNPIYEKSSIRKNHAKYSEIPYVIDPRIEIGEAHHSKY